MVQQLATGALGFPADFVWGTATAAYQIEGSVAADGRTPSIWDTFSHQPGMTANGDTGDVACDSYVRWPEDLALLRELGVDSYRFSISWPRIQPEKGSRVNAPGIDHYSRMVDDLLDAGITPLVTLYHWDLPQYLQDAGGWPHRDTAYRFGDYAGAVAQRLGDRVTDWCTLNEPYCSAWVGHLEGRMAPGDRDIALAVPASVHLLLGHGLAVTALRAAIRQSTTPARVGMVANLSPIVAASDDPADVRAAQLLDGHTNRWWLDPLYGRGLPEDMVEAYGVDLGLRDGDLETIAAPTDFLGINYYYRTIAAADPAATGGVHGLLKTREVLLPDVQRTAMGWEEYPDGLRDVIVSTWRNYAPAAIYVTENGAAYDDVPSADGSIADHDRISYVERHLAACVEAIAEGAPLRGFYLWSLLDNFEWGLGFDKRFGIIRVDYASSRRTIKASGHRYAEIIEASRTASG